MTGRKRAIVEIGDLNPEIDLGMLIESQEGLEAKICEGSEASNILSNHKNKGKKKAKPHLDKFTMGEESIASNQTATTSSGGQVGTCILPASLKQTQTQASA